MSIIFRKTAKGVAEIETREHRLPPRVRNALILVDGKRDVAALKGLMPLQVDESLATLLEQAFIRPISSSVERPLCRLSNDRSSPTSEI